MRRNDRKSDEEAEEDVGVVELPRLPEDCIAHVLSLTSPRDVCRLAVVSSTFRSAADSDIVWDRFLPSDLLLLHLLGQEGRGIDEEEHIGAGAAAVGVGSSTDQGSKKQLFFYLCDHAILLPGATTSSSRRIMVWLDRGSGAKCYLLSARELSIVWADTPHHWRWIHHPDSRFQEVAELINVSWLEIRGKIKCSLLSSNSLYGVYLVYKVNGHGRTFSFQPQEATVTVGNLESRNIICLTPACCKNQTPSHRQYFSSHMMNWNGVLGLPVIQEYIEQHVAADEEDVMMTPTTTASPMSRSDGWLEVEMGEFMINNGDDDHIGTSDGDVVEMSLMEVKGGYWKRGLIVQGIEIRPKAAAAAALHTN